MVSKNDNNPGLRRNRLLQGMILWYLLWWSALAISPLDRSDWLLENLLVFILIGALVATYRLFPLSNASYLLLTVFLTLHAVGAHYTYAKVPLGFWMQDAFDLSRNHFDRIVHFAFGLLVGYPVREAVPPQPWVVIILRHHIASCPLQARLISGEAIRSELVPLVLSGPVL